MIPVPFPPLLPAPVNERNKIFDLKMVRPSSSSGRRHLGHFDNTESLNSQDNCANTLQSAIGKDDLLRIMTADYNYSSNHAMLCAEKGDLDGITKLISNGLDIQQCRGLGGFTPLHHACNRGHAHIVSELIKMRIPVNCVNDSGETPLHLAVYAGNILIVEQLLDKGAKINLPNKEGETVLFYAARRNQPAIARLLLQRGADCTVRDKYGDLAIDHVPIASKNLIQSFEQHSALARVGNNSSSYGTTASSSSSSSSAAAGKNSKTTYSPFDKCTYNDLLHVYEYLCVSDVLRCACVATKWHRVSENPSVWVRLGIRRWELALQNSLGFLPSTTSGFYKPPLSNKTKSSSSNSSGTSKGSDNNNRSKLNSKRAGDH
eukprot:gene29777-38922_t